MNRIIACAFSLKDVENMIAKRTGRDGEADVHQRKQPESVRKEGE